MYNLCVFAGTTEGRKLIEYLATQPVRVTACVATEYGQAMLGSYDNVTVMTGRLPGDSIKDLLRKGLFDLVIDATHPYASHITESLCSACHAVGVEYLRLLRESADAPADALFFPDAASAVEYLNTADGNILLTTGSKELASYTGVSDFARRVYARVLPMAQSLDACRHAGLPPDHIFAMQGPFSQEMNVAMLHAANARFLVTKDGGSAGGFEEKASAARQTGMQLIVIGRPPQLDGISISETIKTLCRRFSLSVVPEVAIVGIGPGSRSAMTREVCDAIDSADCLIGAARMLRSASRPGQSTFDAISPQSIAQYIASHPEHRRFAVLLSGDTGFFSGAKKLLPLLSDCSVRVLPGVSSLAALCARLHTSYEDVVTVSLHGRSRDIVSDVRANARVFVLLGGENSVSSLCAALTEAGLGHVSVHVGQRLSYPDESVITAEAHALAGRSFDPLSVALIENEHPCSAVTHGLPDDAFIRASDSVVPMTKSEVRSVCLSKLRLTRDAVCWDIGAGTGSVAIEMALQARSGQVYAIEKKNAAVSLLRENQARFSVQNLTIVHGCAPQDCAALPAPTHAFIGGSSGNMRSIIAQLIVKNPRVRIVATAVSLETVAELTACLNEFDFSYAETVLLSVARSKAVGPYHMMAGQNPIHVFTMQNGCDNA
ncbi:MAG TPA: precorrin-6A reductase [Candidatus Ventrousia excrementavium]|uniref:Precorrin-6A reductase n=1 Tax=Candidatus Ventrousia excrementavium TaxID=2840961 RepID=A0A9D1S1W1_9CLOT|nr:precorrin-6A reductase [Candidatus Ventrousia excrementavium]